MEENKKEKNEIFKLLFNGMVPIMFDIQFIGEKFACYVSRSMYLINFIVNNLLVKTDVSDSLKYIVIKYNDNEIYWCTPAGVLYDSVINHEDDNFTFLTLTISLEQRSFDECKNCLLPGFPQKECLLVYFRSNIEDFFDKLIDDETLRVKLFVKFSDLNNDVSKIHDLLLDPDLCVDDIFLEKIYNLFFLPVEELLRAKEIKIAVKVMDVDNYTFNCIYPKINKESRLSDILPDSTRSVIIQGIEFSVSTPFIDIIPLFLSMDLCLYVICLS